jgi:hypothetical protein
MHVTTTKTTTATPKFKYFFDVFGSSAEGKEVRVASAVQRRSEGRTSRGAGEKARLRDTSNRGAHFRKIAAGNGTRDQVSGSRFGDLKLEDQVSLDSLGCGN